MGLRKSHQLYRSRFPNLLVNGSSGIAVGMATNIPPHNLCEVIDGINMLIDNPDTTILELMSKDKRSRFSNSGNYYGQIRNKKCL